MDGWKSMLFGGKPASSSSAVKWLGMGPTSDDTGRKNDQMFVARDAAAEVLAPLGEQQVNLISIFGAARQGKSFLMNLLADQQDLFQISNLREPCTQGVDLSSHFIPLGAFSALNNCPPVTAAHANIQIGFVDAEGQGDRDITYDSRLVSPVLLASKTVIFNWKDSLQADRMLNLLAVLARAAQGIELADGDTTKVFGHLHIVFRDWSFVDSTPDAVYADLFQREKGRSDEVNVRNLARSSLVDAFESITIWLFPAPVANTANLRDKIRFDQLQRPFQDQLRALRKTLSSQLTEPMRFNREPLTARLLAQIMPALVETLNSDQVILPESIYASMVRAEARVAQDECEKSIAAVCESAASVNDVAAAATFEATLQRDVEYMIAEALESLQAMPASVRRDVEASLKAFATKEIRMATHAMNDKVASLLSDAVDASFASLERESEAIEQLLPMRSETLSKKTAELLKSEVQKLHALPTTIQIQTRVDTEIRRLNQHARVLFDRLEVANAKATQLIHGAVAEQTRIAKQQMTTDAHGLLDKHFGASNNHRKPVTVATLQVAIEEMYQMAVRRIPQDANVPTSLLSDEYIADVEAHKATLANEINRRYLLEMRQFVNEVGYEARDQLSADVARSLDKQLPLADEELKARVDAAVNRVKESVAQKLQGWTVLKTDIAAKSTELETLGDLLTDTYLQKNVELLQAEANQQQTQQFAVMRQELSDKFEAAVQAPGVLPTTDDAIDALFNKLLQTLAAQFLSYDYNTNAGHTATTIRQQLTAELRPVVANQKVLNRLAKEKVDALEDAKRERLRREQDAAAAQQKHEELTALQTQVAQSLETKANESKRLRDELQAQGARSQQLEEQMRALQQQAADAVAAQMELAAQAQQQQQADAQQRQYDAQQLQQQVDAMRLRAAEVEREKAALEAKIQHDAALERDSATRLRLELEALKRQNDKIAAENIELERRAVDETMRSEEAVVAARSAAAAAAVSARAALDAAAHEEDEEDEDIAMEDVSRRARRAPAAAKATAATGPSKKRRSTGPTKAKKTTPDKSGTLEAARKAARDEVERRIQERAQSLMAKKH